MGFRPSSSRVESSLTWTNVTRPIACWFALAIEFFALAAAAGPSMPWSTDYAASMKKAEEEGKPVLIDFTAEWCVWCKRLDEEVYADASVVNALKDFVCLKIDVDQQSNVALAYNVQSMPRTIVLNVHGEIIGDITGYQPLGPFLQFLDGLKDDLTRKTGGTGKPDVRQRVDSPRIERPAITAETPTEEIIALLGDRDPRVREEAIAAINEKPDKREVLVAALASDNLGTRIAACEALRKAGHNEIEFDPWAPKDVRAAALPEWQRWAGQASPHAEGAVAP